MTLVQHRPSYCHANLMVVDAFDRNNERCYTALFRDSDQNIYLMAVGGNLVGVNRSGVYWYRTREDAIEAVEGVIVHWQNVQFESTVFDRLLDTNLSNTYSVVMRPYDTSCRLKKGDWTYKYLNGDQGLVNASFTSWFSPNFPSKTFTSMAKGVETVENDGLYYHRNVKKAQASAFLDFLKCAKSHGLLLSLTMTPDSRTLPFWKTS